MVTSKVDNQPVEGVLKEENCNQRSKNKGKLVTFCLCRCC